MGMMRYLIITLLLFSLVENFEFQGAHNYTCFLYLVLHCMTIPIH